MAELSSHNSADLCRACSPWPQIVVCVRSTVSAPWPSSRCSRTTPASRSCPAGFIGVDVFFVLSGFLITSLLYAELTATGRIDLGAFWTRRARRLLPAALAMIVAVIAARPLFPPDAVAGLRGDHRKRKTVKLTCEICGCAGQRDWCGCQGRCYGWSAGGPGLPCAWRRAGPPATGHLSPGSCSRRRAATSRDTTSRTLPSIGNSGFRLSAGRCAKTPTGKNRQDALLAV